MTIGESLGSKIWIGLKTGFLNLKDHLTHNPNLISSMKIYFDREKPEAGKKSPAFAQWVELIQEQEKD